MKKNLIALSFVFVFLCGLISGCSGPMYEETFLSELLADTSINLSHTKYSEIRDFCESKDVPIKELNSTSGRTLVITDAFLDYDASYTLYFDEIVERNENEYLVLKDIIVEVKFDSEKDVDDGVSKIKQHIAGGVGAGHDAIGDRYVLFIEESDEVEAYARFTCKVEKEKTAVVRMKYEFYPAKDAGMIRAFINTIPDFYYANNVDCVMVKPSKEDAPFVYFPNTHPMRVYGYVDGQVQEIQQDEILNYGYAAIKFISNHQIAVAGAHDDSGKYALYSYDDGKISLEKSISKSTYESYSSIPMNASDTIVQAYKNMVDWEKQAESLQKKDIMKSYVKYMNDEFGVEAHGAKYRFVDLDNNGIMELLYDCSSSAAGMGILSYYDGEIVDNHLEDGAIKYKDGENKIFHDYGRMGYNGSRIYHLENGDLKAETSGEYNEVVVDGEFNYEYFLDGKEVTSSVYSMHFGKILSDGKWIEFSSLSSNLTYNNLNAEIEKMK